MDKLFLDANILFSSAYREQAGLLRFWQLPNIKLYSSLYAIEEADRNSPEKVQQSRLNKLLDKVEIIGHEQTTIALPAKIKLPQKDRPILQAAIYAKADFLITGDFKDFGKYFGKTIQKITILPPAEYLKNL